jgi:hypothetical protein
MSTKSLLRKKSREISSRERGFEVILEARRDGDRKKKSKILFTNVYFRFNPYLFDEKIQIS